MNKGNFALISANKEEELIKDIAQIYEVDMIPMEGGLKYLGFCLNLINME